MNEQVFTIVQITYTAFLPVFLAWFVKHVNMNTSGRKADCLLLRKALIDIHDEAIEKGYVTRDAFQEFEDVWKLYHDVFKGNTLTDSFREELHGLPKR